MKVHVPVRNVVAIDVQRGIRAIWLRNSYSFNWTTVNIVWLPFIDYHYSAGFTAIRTMKTVVVNWKESDLSHVSSFEFIFRANVCKNKTNVYFYFMGNLNKICYSLWNLLIIDKFIWINIDKNLLQPLFLVLKVT